MYTEKNWYRESATMLFRLNRCRMSKANFMCFNHQHDNWSSVFFTARIQLKAWRTVPVIIRLLSLQGHNKKLIDKTSLNSHIVITYCFPPSSVFLDQYLAGLKPLSCVSVLSPSAGARNWPDFRVRPYRIWTAYCFVTRFELVALSGFLFVLSIYALLVLHIKYRLCTNRYQLLQGTRFAAKIRHKPSIDVTWTRSKTRSSIVFVGYSLQLDGVFHFGGYMQPSREDHVSQIVARVREKEMLLHVDPRRCTFHKNENVSYTPDALILFRLEFVG